MTQGQSRWERLEGLVEYACHEGNYALANVLSGQRHLEGIEAQGRR